MTAKSVFGGGAGDSSIWLFTSGGRQQLTSPVFRKPLLGSGEAIPYASATGTLIAATEGLWKYTTLALIKETIQKNCPRTTGTLAGEFCPPALRSTPRRYRDRNLSILRLKSVTNNGLVVRYCAIIVSGACRESCQSVSLHGILTPSNATDQNRPARSDCRRSESGTRNFPLF